MPTCFLSIDIEPDYGSPFFVKTSAGGQGFSGIDNLDRILNILQKHGVSATFFITGKALEKYPEKFKALNSQYEIGCHGGMSHRFWPSLSNEERRKELSVFLEVFQGIFGKKPLGFRAPSHLIDKEGIDLLGEVGFQYDSSIVPHYPFFTRYRGYQGKAPLLPYYLKSGDLRTKQKLKDPRTLGILEIPVAGLPFFGIPLAGTWIRKLPFFIYQILLFFFKPKFLTLNLHSWDSLNDKTLKNLDRILGILAKKYRFLTGEQILNDINLSKVVQGDIIEDRHTNVC